MNRPMDHDEDEGLNPATLRGLFYFFLSVIALVIGLVGLIFWASFSLWRSL